MQATQIGTKVRVNLHGRRVGGWVVAIGDSTTPGFSSAFESKLIPLVSVSGAGVEPYLVDLVTWVATMWCGPIRAVLSSATAPLVRMSRGSPQRGRSVKPTDDVVATSTRLLIKQGGGVLVVPPLQSAISVIAAAAEAGPVLALCPTIRMCMLGAASLRRRGLVVAVMPDDWSRAASGVDVVIGARSGVWAPCVGMASVVVIDEHDESYWEERVPTWNAPEVARERARRAGVAYIAVSSVPSLRTLSTVAPEHIHETPVTANGWPQFVVEDLSAQSVKTSLVTTSLVQELRDPKKTVLAIFNTTGGGRLLACKQCRTIAKCSTCATVLAQDQVGVLRCGVCDTAVPAVCHACGRTVFSVLRAGTAQLQRELSATAARTVVEVTKETSLDKLDLSCAYVGTEALLYRVSSADVVVFLDIDAELMAPRLSALADTLALLVRAARVVGIHGRIIVQTRAIDHPLIQAIQKADAPHIQEAIMVLLRSEAGRRRSMALPPVAYCSLVEGLVSEPPQVPGIQIATMGNVKKKQDDASNVYLIKSELRNDLVTYLVQLRQTVSEKVRVRIDPPRM